MSQTDTILDEILSKLRSSLLTPAGGGISSQAAVSSIFNLTNSLEKNPVTPENFHSFLESVHDILINLDAAKKSSMFRVIRFCLSSPAHVKILISNDVTWVVIISLEQDNESNIMERTQALKIIEKVRKLAPEIFPVSFGRSLVAIANSKEDSFRKVCIDSLKELALFNPALVAAVHGFPTLLDAVIEPINPEHAESILYTLVYLLNEPQTRKVVTPCIDLKQLLSPLTDLDSDPSDLKSKWLAVKNSITLLMKSWVGIVLLTSDELALPAIVKLLRDPKIPSHVQANILDLFSAILEPVMNKLRNGSTRSYRQEPYLAAAAMSARRYNSNGQSNNFMMMMRPSLVGPSTSVDGKVVPMMSSNSDPDFSKSSNSSLMGRNAIMKQQRNSLSLTDGLNNLNNNPGNSNSNGNSGRTGGNLKSVSSTGNLMDLSTNNKPPLSATKTPNKTSSSATNSGGSNVPPPVPSNSRASTRGGIVGMFAQAFRRGSSTTDNINQMSSSSGATNSNNTNNNNNRSLPPPPPHTIAASDSSRKRPSMTDHFFSSSTHNQDALRSSLSKSNSRQDGNLTSFYEDPNSAMNSPNNVQREITGEFDPIFNLLENYTAIVGCAFLHMGLIHSLFVLGVDGSMDVAKSSRKLLISFLKIVASFLPENACADLLTNPILIQLAVEVNHTASTANLQNMYRAHQSGQILIDLAEAFSVMPYKQQTSGSHFSNLSTGNAFGNNNTYNLSSSSMGRNRTGSNANRNNNSNSGSSTSGVSGNSNLNPNAGGMITQRANFQVLNIKTIFELAEEIKISSLSTIVVNGRKASTSSAATPGGANNNNNALTKGYNNNYNNNYMAMDGGITFGTADALFNLRTSLAPMVDKNDFLKQMETSRIIGKEGKEPFKWDWLTISDMLEYSFDNMACLSEALKTKWVRRLSGFYRCTPDEKGYFANLDWEPTHLQYLESACNLYSVLLKDPQGRDFLTSDRRGMLFVQMTSELENVIQLVSKPAQAHASMHLFGYSGHVSSSGGANNAGGGSGGSSGGSGSAGGSGGNSNKCVFRPQSMTTTMSREFFTLLGRIVRNPWSRRLLDNTNIFQCLSRIGSFMPLDYLSRVIATSLFFHDGGTLSKHILQFWTANGCSTPLKYYMHGLLRTMAQTLSAYDPGYWCIDSIVTQLMNDEGDDDDDDEDIAAIDCNQMGESSNLYKAMAELIHSKASLRAIVSKRPRVIFETQHCHNKIVKNTLLVRMAAIPEGIAFLQAHVHPASVANTKATTASTTSTPTPTTTVTAKEADTTDNNDNSNNNGPQNWLEYEVSQWMSHKCKEYVQQVEESVNIALVKPQLLLRNDMVHRKLIEPIPIRAPADYITDMLAKQQQLGNGFNNTDAGFAGGINPNATLVTDTRGFLRLPWHMEVKLNNNNFSISNTMGFSGNDPTNSVGDYIKMDTFVDLSPMSSPLVYETTCDNNRLFLVRAFVCDGKGQQSGCIIHSNALVHATLMVGICPVNKSGGIQTAPGGRVARRRSTTSAVNMTSGGNNQGGGSSNANNNNNSNATTERGSFASNTNTSTANNNNNTSNNARASLANGGSSSSGLNNLNGNNNATGGKEASDDYFSTMMGGADFDHSDNPVTLGQERVFEWFTCRPGHRQGNIFELQDGKFAVALPNEPIVFIFSRRSPSANVNNPSTAAGYTSGGANANTRASRSGSLAPTDFNNYNKGTGRTSSVSSATSLFEVSNNNRSGFNSKNMDASRAGSSFYLVEIQYFFRLETGQSMFVPMPLHLYGELSRSSEGLEFLTKRSIIFDTVSKAHTIYDQLLKSANNVQPLNLFNNNNGPSTNSNYTNTLDLRAALWSLAQIGSGSEQGFQAILACDAKFVAWCIEGACHCPYFSIRGTFFHVLGLLGRSVAGARVLQQSQWSVSGFTVTSINTTSNNNNTGSSNTNSLALTGTHSNSVNVSPMVTTLSSRPPSLNATATPNNTNNNNNNNNGNFLSSMSTNAAVAVPHNPSILFKDCGTVGVAGNSNSSSAAANYNSFMLSLNNVGNGHVLRRASSGSVTTTTSTSSATTATSSALAGSGVPGNNVSSTAGVLSTSVSASALSSLGGNSSNNNSGGGVSASSVLPAASAPAPTTTVVLPTVLTSATNTNTTSNSTTNVSFFGTNTGNVNVAASGVVQMSHQLQRLTPTLTSTMLTPEQEVINLICKFPGNIMYKESKNRLEALRREHPHVFQSRALFVTVMHLLDMFTFKLPQRREIVALFFDQAKRKVAPLATVKEEDKTKPTDGGDKETNRESSSSSLSEVSSVVSSTVLDDPVPISSNANVMEALTRGQH